MDLGRELIVGPSSFAQVDLTECPPADLSAARRSGTGEMGLPRLVEAALDALRLGPTRHLFL
jgi:hypothetical protein